MVVQDYNLTSQETNAGTYKLQGSPPLHSKAT